MKPKSKANKLKRPTTVGSGDLLGCVNKPIISASSDSAASQEQALLLRMRRFVASALNATPRTFRPLRPKSAKSHRQKVSDSGAKPPSCGSTLKGCPARSGQNQTAQPSQQEVGRVSPQTILIRDQSYKRKQPNVES